VSRLKSCRTLADTFHMPIYVAMAYPREPEPPAPADETERERRVAASLMKQLHDAGMFRLLLPRSLDGAEIDPITYVRVIEEVAKADASTAWCLNQNNVCSVIAGYLEPAAAREIFGPADAVLAWGSQGGDGYAQAADQGFRVTGTWAFASGGRRATWLGAHCPIVELDGTRRMTGGAPEIRTMMFPIEQAVMTDIWHVMGLRGTGSDAYTVKELFVPEAHAAKRDVPAERRHPSLLYCVPTGSFYASGFAGLALGIARTSLDELTRLAMDKTPRGQKNTMRENQVIQSQVGQAEARLRSARAFLFGSLTEIWKAVVAGREMTFDQRMQIRLASTWTINESEKVVSAAYSAAGSTAIFQNQAFERRFRDIHAVTQQVQGRPVHFETVGAHLMGLETDSPFV
jgi:alkylation response protein AidB-like acyl-CoA dehydrogenase